MKDKENKNTNKQKQKNNNITTTKTISLTTFHKLGTRARQNMNNFSSTFSLYSLVSYFFTRLNKNKTKQKQNKTKTYKLT